MAYDDTYLNKTTKSSSTVPKPAVATGSKTTSPSTYTPKSVFNTTPKTPTTSTTGNINPAFTSKPTSSVPAAPTTTGSINPALTTKPTPAAQAPSSYAPPILFHNTPGSTPSTSYSPTPASSTPSGNYSAPTNVTSPNIPTTPSATPADPKVTIDPMEATTPINMTPEQQQSQAQAITSVDSVMQGYQQIQQDAKSMGNDGLIALAAQWDKMLATIDQVQAQITDQIKSQMNGDDPAMQNAIKLIRDEADKMRAETLDELNARGLVQSGVYARALSDMNTTELNQVQTAVASRFGDLQTQLNSAIMSLAQTRISALASNQSAMTSMMTNTQNNVLQAGLAGMNSAVTVRGQDIQNNQAKDALAQNQNQYNTTLQYNKDQLAASSQQFYDQLSQQDKQFYDQLSSTEKLALASAASGGGSSGTSLAQQQFEFTKQQYADGLAAGEQANTYTQVANATASKGFVDQAIANIKSGKTTVGQVQSVLTNGGYTAAAQQTIMGMITSNADVKKKTSTSTTSTKSSYTPTGSSNLTGGYLFK